MPLGQPAVQPLVLVEVRMQVVRMLAAAQVVRMQVAAAQVVRMLAAAQVGVGTQTEPVVPLEAAAYTRLGAAVAGR
jgi:hypothetical protein